MSDAKIEKHLHKAEELIVTKCFDDADFEVSCAEELAYEDGQEGGLAWRVDLMKGRVELARGDYDQAEIWLESCYGMKDAIVEEIQFWRGINFFEWGKVDDAENQLSCAFLNGGEDLFSKVDKKYYELIKDDVE